VAERPSGPADLNRLWDTISAIPGWLPYPDAYLFWLLNTFQKGESVCGNILEIGVFKGQSAALLGHLLAEGEQLEVCDLFGQVAPTPENAQENEACYPNLDRTAFEDNYRSVHADLPKVHPISSNELAGRLPPQSFRMIHVDGSHLYEAVRDDVRLSRDKLAGRGIVVLDDWCHSDYPEVAAAIWDEVSFEALMPLITTDQKMYATWPESWSDDALVRLFDHIGSWRDFDASSHRFSTCSFIRLRLKGWTSTDSRCL